MTKKATHAPDAFTLAARVVRAYEEFFAGYSEDPQQTLRALSPRWTATTK
jgi:GTP cyclohydrolase I